MGAMLEGSRAGVLLLLFLGVGCGAESPSYPQAWALSPSAEAIDQLERIGWDPQTFYELVCLRAGELCEGVDIEFHLDQGGGVVSVAGTRSRDGFLGTAANGSGHAEVNQAEIFHHILGAVPEHAALVYFPIDDASYLVALIVAHEVGHALSLPHNPHSSVMRAQPALLALKSHAFTDEEIVQMRSATGQ